MKHLYPSEKGVVELSADGSDATNSDPPPTDRHRQTERSPGKKIPKDSQHGTVRRTNASFLRRNWFALLFWSLILCCPAALLLYGVTIEIGHQQRIARIQDTLQFLEVRTREMAYQSQRAQGGNEKAIGQLQVLGMEVGHRWPSMVFGIPDGWDDRLQVERREMQDVWARLQPMLAKLSHLEANLELADPIRTHVDQIHRQAPALLTSMDRLRERLVQIGAPLIAIDLGYRLRAQMQQTVTGANVLAAGNGDLEAMIIGMHHDTRQADEIMTEILTIAGRDVAPQIRTIAAAWQRLVRTIELLQVHAVDYMTIRDTARTIERLSASLLENVLVAKWIVAEKAEEPAWMQELSRWESLPGKQELPWLLGALGGVGLIGLVWNLMHHANRRQKMHIAQWHHALETVDHLAKGDWTLETIGFPDTSDDASDLLRDAMDQIRQRMNNIRIASGKLSSALDQVQPLLSAALPRNQAQRESVSQVSAGMDRMDNVLERIQTMVRQVAEQAEGVGKSTAAYVGRIEHTASTMSHINAGIQDMEKGLQRVGQSSRQVGRVVQQVREITEQAHILGLNASIQASMAGEAGKGLVLVADDVKRLAERFTGAAEEIAEIARTIRHDTDAVIEHLQSAMGVVSQGIQQAKAMDPSRDESKHIQQALQDLAGALSTITAEGSSEVHRISGVRHALAQTVEREQQEIKEVMEILRKTHRIMERLEQVMGGFRLS